MPTDAELDLLGRLVACPSVTGTPSRIDELLAGELVARGMTVSRVSGDPAATAGSAEHSPPSAAAGPHPPVLLAQAPGNGPELLLFAHTDTEPVHEGWPGDPFTMQVAAGRASGLGVADDKAGVVAVLAAVDRWTALGRPGWRPRIVLGAGKQGGALGTLPGVLAARGVRAALYSHPAESGAGLGQLKVASRGVVTCRVQLFGLTPEPVEERTPVSADPATGNNAAVLAAGLVNRVQGWRDADRVWSVVGLRAGGVPFQVPGTAEVDVACWFSAGTVEQTVAELTRRLLAGGQGEQTRSPVVSVVGLRANPADCAGTAFAEQVAGVVQQHTGAAPGDYRWHSASDIRFPARCLGVPSVGLGAHAGGFYGPGEWVDLASLDQSTAVITAVLAAGPP